MDPRAKPAGRGGLTTTADGTRVSRVLGERETSTAVLVVAGSASDMRCLLGPRVLPVGDLLELGRTSAES